MNSQSYRIASSRGVLEASWRINRLMTLFWMTSIAMMLVSIGGLLLDSRLVLGQPNWMKSLKFSISFVLYAPTMLWMFRFTKERWPKLTRFVLNGAAITLWAETILLLIQAVRGQASHFNIATPFDTFIWAAMGNAIAIFYLISIVGAVLVLRQSLQSRSLAWSIRLGMILMLIGFGLGFLMTTPTSEQLVKMDNNENPGYAGAHTVGAADGGPGLPLTGWSTEGGDLRIAHFIGIHGVQVLILVGLWLERRSLGEKQRLAIVWASAVGYAGLVGIVTWQALRGQPLLQPDSLTLIALGGLIAGLGVAIALVVRKKPTLMQQTYS